MQKILATPAGIQIQLTFWRTLVLMAEFALEHRRFVQLGLRYAPVLFWGAAAYLLGWTAGGILLSLAF